MRRSIVLHIQKTAAKSSSIAISPSTADAAGRVGIPYSVFDKDQRVTHAAITENKHLSAVQEHIKAEQDKSTPKKRRAGKQATRYQPTDRRNDGSNSKLAKRAKKQAGAAPKHAAE